MRSYFSLLNQCCLSWAFKGPLVSSKSPKMRRETSFDNRLLRLVCSTYISGCVRVWKVEIGLPFPTLPIPFTTSTTVRSSRATIFEISLISGGATLPSARICPLEGSGRSRCPRSGRKRGECSAICSRCIGIHNNKWHWHVVQKWINLYIYRRMSVSLSLCLSVCL